MSHPENENSKKSWENFFPVDFVELRQIGDGPKYTNGHINIGGGPERLDDKSLNGTNPPTKLLDSNVKNAASQTGKQTWFIVLLQAKNFFSAQKYLVLKQIRNFRVTESH